jgi:co-chaperonin GroES (HSP10)
VPDIEPVRAGALYLPEEMAANRKPDVGTVIASQEPDIRPGDRMVYAPWAGLWIRPCRIGPYRVHDLRFYGMPDDGEDTTKTMREPLGDVLPAKIGRTIEPIRDNVVIRRDPLKVTSGALSLALPDDAKHRTLKATVFAAGPWATVGDRVLQPGDRVMYNPHALVLGLTSLGPIEGFEGDLSDYAIIKAGNLLALIED